MIARLLVRDPATGSTGFAIVDKRRGGWAPWVAFESRERDTAVRSRLLLLAIEAAAALEAGRRARQGRPRKERT